MFVENYLPQLERDIEQATASLSQPMPDAVRTALQGELGKLQRKLSKKQKTKDPQTKRTVFSKNYEKQRLKVARQHQQIANIRRDVQHKFTTELARTCGVIGIEDLVMAHLSRMARSRL